MIYESESHGFKWLHDVWNELFHTKPIVRAKKFLLRTSESYFDTKMLRLEAFEWNLMKGKD